MSATTRTFVAIAIPEPLGRALARLQTSLSPEAPGFRWVTSLSFHATLAFLGDVPQAELSRLYTAIATSTRTVEPFELELKGIGAFPDAARPRVVWAGLAEPEPTPLRKLQKQVAQAVTDLGYRLEDRDFHSHVTLGRSKFDRRGTCDLSALLERYRSWSGGSFRVDEVMTFASMHGKDGPRYDPLARAPLSAK